MGKKWDLQSKKEVFNSKWMSIEDRIYKLPNGHVNNYLHFNRPDYVLVLAIDEKNRIVVEKQYRRGVDEFVYELPAGWIEKDEGPAEAAIRELKEETGFLGESMWSQEVFAQPGFSSVKAYVVCIKIKAQDVASNDTDEDIKYTFKSLNDIKSLIKSGEIKDMGFLSALSIYTEKTD